MRPAANHLRRIPLFRGMPVAEIQKLMGLSKVHRLLPQEKLTLNNSQGRLYVLLSGSANILQLYLKQETFLLSVQSGEFFGSPPLSGAEKDCSTQAVANSPCEILEFEWKALLRHLKKKSSSAISTVFFERVLTAAAQKFSYLSREYCHLVQQAGVPEDVIDALFPPQRDGVVRSDEELRP